MFNSVRTLNARNLVGAVLVVVTLVAVERAGARFGLQLDLGITKTDGVTTVTAGGSTTYTIVATNVGSSPAAGSNVTDTFPGTLTCNWTCTGANGGTCAASGSGSINDAVNLPLTGSVTYTALCAISSGATGTLSNTATVTGPTGMTDANPSNNTANDTDTINAAVPSLPIVGVILALLMLGTIGGMLAHRRRLTHA